MPASGAESALGCGCGRYLGDETLKEAARRLMDRRAVRLVHAGEVGRAPAALGRDGVLGVMRPGDVHRR
jgi:hypothetical protein